MKTDNFEKILGAIDEKTVERVLINRYKKTSQSKAERAEIQKTEKTVYRTEGESPLAVRILKGVSVAAVVVLIAAFAYICYLPIYMQNHGMIPPAAGSEETAGRASVYTTEPDEPYPERVEDYFRSWTDPDRTDKISPEDAGKIKEGMTLREVVELLGKPKFDVGSGGFVMEWAIDNGEFLHVTIGSNRSYIENRESIGDFYVITYTIDSEPVALAEPITEPPATETISFIDNLVGIK